MAQPFASLSFGWPLTFVPLSSGGGRPAGDALAEVPDDRKAWAVLAPPEALAAPSFERMVRIWSENRPDVDLFYGDDAALGETELARRLRLKPAFNLSLLAAQDYIGAPLIVRGSVLHQLGGVRGGMGEAGLYDLVLRAEAAGVVIDRIPHLLMAWPGLRPDAPVADRRRALADWIGARPFEAADGLAPGTLQLRRRFEAFPDVTLVVPTRQSGPKEGGLPYVVELLDTLAATDWPMERLSVLIGDDTDKEESFPASRWPFQVRRMATPRAPGEAFNYAAKMNRLWRATSSEHLVLMNDDVKVRSPGWLKALMTFAMEADVGGVGARLLFPDGRLQHAGMTAGLCGAAVAHLWHAQPGDRPTYQDWALVHRDWSIVTGAVFATRRAALEAVNGFDERFTLEFNDVDLSLRLRLLNHRIVYTPFAELTHREMASRGNALPAGEEVALFLNRWRAWLAEDPAYHPALSRDRLAPEPAEAADEFRA
ncbi:MAG TPA: glycosyltransferase [Caulobacteraceae bacterium]|jgi:hypothetical protein|nr:glycosyltransferase [Caulobacteraceae bacterium]